MGGEDNTTGRQGPIRLGSPPHGRGGPIEVFTMPMTSGLTPAWAGRTHWGSALLSATRAHPRMGGEDLGQLEESGVGDGLTPAWAGRTLGSETGSWALGAHPRVGGEDWVALVVCIIALWLTPAWAGRT